MRHAPKRCVCPAAWKRVFWPGSACCREPRRATVILPGTALNTPARRLAVGALVDWRLHRRVSAEAGFLAYRFGHSRTLNRPGFTQTESIAGYAWEVPLLFKWRAARIGRGQLWAGAGPAMRRASHVEWLSGSNAVPPMRLPAAWISRSALGFAAAGGMEWRAGGARLRPELRYSRFERPFYDLYYVRRRPDSLHFLLGVSWISRAADAARR